MPKFTSAFIGRVRDSADIVAIIGRHVELKRAGANYAGLCPFHTDKNPSFNVVPGKKIFKCFGCDAKGDVFAFIGRLKNLKFGDSVKLLAQELNIPVEYEPESPRPARAPRAATPAAPESPAEDSEVPPEVSDAEADQFSASADTAVAASVASAPPVAAAALPPLLPAETPAAPPAAVSEEEALIAGGGVESEEPTPSEQSAAALREFYAALSLNEEDVARHWQKRGLQRSTLLDYGIRSGVRSNLDIIQRLFAKYPQHALVHSGLYIQREGESARPSPKFYGYGIAGKKPKTERRNKDDKFNYGWVFPPLIPYLGEDQQVYFLRPHKDQVAGTTNRFFVPRPLPRVVVDGGEIKDLSALRVADYESTCHQAIITEGELKALALHQIVGDESLGDARWAVAALPGITNAKPMFSDVVEWLDFIEARSVVVVYDNESKGDPKLPGFVENEWERYDAEGWARYLALQLRREGFQASVGHLPDDWRDDKGKADWDGALVKLLRQFTNTAKDAALPAESEISDEVWKKIRYAFLKVLKDATPADMLRQFGLFDREAERHIQNLVNRISKVPQLPIGGRNEESIAKRIQRFIKKSRNDTKLLPLDRRAALAALAKKYLELDGRYYVLKELGDRAAPKWEKEKQKAEDLENVEYKRIVEVAQRGIPHWISDFHIKAHYCLKKIDGKRERLVTIKNIHGVESPVVALPSDAFAQPSKFREWLLNVMSCATWKAGERELNDLQADIGKDVSWLDVAEISYRGFNDESGIVFYEDVGFLKDGKEIYPDKHTGIFWHEGSGFRQGYKLSRLGNAKQPFRMGFPKMHPKRPDPENLSEFFTDACDKFIASIGWSMDEQMGYDGFVCLGVSFSCFAGPEIYDHYVGMPGLWLHGESQQGKNCATRWLLPIHGYERQKSGIVLPGSTEAGLGHALEQYSNMFVWLEEYQPEMARTKPWLVEKIKNAFDRSSGTKMVFGDELRQIRAVALVNGIATASDPQVKNRYAHVQVSEKFRKANHYDWFESNSPDFFFFGRHILRHRARFSKILMDTMAEWMSSDSTKGIDSRAKIVYGSAYAGMVAAAEIFNSPVVRDNMQRYKAWLCRKAREAASEIREKINANQFWVDLMSAVEAGAFGYGGSDLKRFFKAIPKPNAASPVPEPQQTGDFLNYPWKSYYLYMTPNPVIEILRAFKMKSHRDLPLDTSDLFRQMQTKPYFVNAPQGKARIRIRFKAKSAQDCWCIDLDKHELGYTAVDDDELRFSLRREGEDQGDGMVVPTDWNDPRQGDLFTLIHKLLLPDSTS